MMAARSPFLEKGEQMMGRSNAWFYLGAVALATVAVAPVQVAAQKPTKVNGVIAGRSGANMMVRTATGTTTVTLNDATKVDSLEIRWPSGKVETMKDLKADQFYSVLEGSGIVDRDKIVPKKK